MTRDGAAVRIAVWCYGLLLRALPPALYGEFAREMVADFREIVRGARGRGGVIAVALATLRAIVDAMTRGAGE